MIIRWIGECCFLLQDSLGRRILTDPFDNHNLDNLLKLNPKLITISHNHINSIEHKIENKNCDVLSSPGTYNFDYCNIEAINSYHDKFNGSKRGSNIIYKFNFDNMTLLHLGHLGHLPDNTLLSSFKNIDILFIPIGGHFTINGIEAAILTNLIKPKIAIPMYYKDNSHLSYLDSPKNYLTSMKYINNLKTDTIDTSKLFLDNSLSNQVLFMKNNFSS